MRKWYGISTAVAILNTYCGGVVEESAPDPDLGECEMPAGMNNDWDTWGHVGPRWSAPQPDAHGDEIRWGASSIQHVDVPGLGTFTAAEGVTQLIQIERNARVWSVDCGITLLTPQIAALPVGAQFSGVFRVETGTGVASFVRYVELPFANFPNPGFFGDGSTQVVNIPNLPAKTILVTVLWQVNTLVAVPGGITVRLQACAAPVVRR